MRRAMLIALRLVALAAVGALAACLPAPLGSYYRPLYPDAAARHAGEQCAGQAGAPVALSVALADGVMLRVDARAGDGERRGGGRPLHIAIEIPRGTRAQFSSDEIRLSGSRGDAGSVIDAQVAVSASVMVAGDAVVDLAKIAPTPLDARGAAPAPAGFSAATSFNFAWDDGFAPSSIAFAIPAIVVLDGAPREVPALRIDASAKRRRPGAGNSLIYASADSERALAERYARCTRETPAAACEQIVDYDEGRYRLEQQGFVYTGRFYVFDAARPSPFSGELEIRTTAAVNWRFASNTLGVTDRSTGAQRSVRFERFALRLGYRTSLATPIVGVSDAPHSGNTRLTISASLGADELPRYFVRLPPLSINGTLYRLQPIELERRVFDFALEPFNC